GVPGRWRPKAPWATSVGGMLRCRPPTVKARTSRPGRPGRPRAGRNRHLDLTTLSSRLAMLWVGKEDRGMVKRVLGGATTVRTRRDRSGARKPSQQIVTAAAVIMAAAIGVLTFGLGLALVGSPWELHFAAHHLAAVAVAFAGVTVAGLGVVVVIEVLGGGPHLRHRH